MSTSAETRSRAQVLSKLKRHASTLDATTAKLTQLEADRLTLYLEARALTPPMTFREIAGVYGITEAAVMQKLKRDTRRAAAVNGTK